MYNQVLFGLRSPIPPATEKPLGGMMTMEGAARVNAWKDAYEDDVMKWLEGEDNQVRGGQEGKRGGGLTPRMGVETSTANTRNRARWGGNI